MVKKIMAVSLKFGEILLIVKAVLIGYEAFIAALPANKEEGDKLGRYRGQDGKNE